MNSIEEISGRYTALGSVGDWISKDSREMVLLTRDAKREPSEEPKV